MTKREDLSGFYSNLLNNNLAPNEADGSLTTIAKRATADQNNRSASHQDAPPRDDLLEEPTLVLDMVPTDQLDEPPPHRKVPLVDDSLASAIAAAVSVDAPRAVDVVPETVSRPSEFIFMYNLSDSIAECKEPLLNR